MQPRQTAHGAELTLTSYRPGGQAMKPSKLRILLIEDSDQLAGSVSRELEREYGHVVTWLRDPTGIPTLSSGQGIAQASTALRSTRRLSALNSCSSSGAASASLPRPAARHSRDVRDHRSSGHLRDTGVRRLATARRTAARPPRAWRSGPRASEEKASPSRGRRLVSGSHPATALTPSLAKRGSTLGTGHVDRAPGFQRMP